MLWVKWKPFFLRKMGNNPFQKQSNIKNWHQIGKFKLNCIPIGIQLFNVADCTSAWFLETWMWLFSANSLSNKLLHISTSATFHQYCKSFPETKHECLLVFIATETKTCLQRWIREVQAVSHRPPAAVILRVLRLWELQVSIISITRSRHRCSAWLRACVLMRLPPYVSGFRFLDAILNFLLVWFYSTLTVRESILISNGSRLVTLHQSDPH